MRYLLLLACTVFFQPSFMMAAEASPSGLIKWHQQACQFIEAEGQDYQYQSTNSDDCKLINKREGEVRMKQSKTIQLKAGDYTFRIYNDNVPYDLGFWLRGEGFSRLSLPSVSGGGIQAGHFKDYHITLKVGDYLYSCPLNPTPDYHLTVTP